MQFNLKKRFAPKKYFVNFRNQQFLLCDKTIKQIQKDTKIKFYIFGIIAGFLFAYFGIFIAILTSSF